MLGTSGSASLRGGRSTSAAAGAVIISSSDIERVRRTATLQAPVLTAKSSEQEYDTALKAARKAASDARAARWPNTLAAMRRRKLSERSARLTAEEDARCAVDAEEEALRAEERVVALERAAAAFVADTDKMKMLHTERHGAHILEVRERQKALSAVKEGLRREADAEHFSELKARLAAAAERDEAEAAQRARVRREVAKQQREQLDEALAARIAASEAEKAEGARIAAAAAAAVAAETAAKAARREREVAANLAMAAANATLRAAKDVQRAAVIAEEERLQQYAAVKAAEAEKRAAIVEAKRVEAARKAGVMSETMARDFMARAGDEETRVAAAIAQAQAKAAAVEETRAARQRQMHADIAAHRALTHERAAADAAAAAAEAAAQRERFRSNVGALEAIEAADAASKRTVAREVQAFHVAQMVDKKRNLEGAGARDRSAAATAGALAVGKSLGGTSSMLDAQSEFEAAAAALLEEERAKGRATGHLERSIRRATREPLIAATALL